MSHSHKLVGDRSTKSGREESDDDEWSDDDEPKSRPSVERNSSSKDRYNMNYPKYKEYPFAERAEDEQKTSRGEPGNNSDSWSSDNEKTPPKNFDKHNNSDDDESEVSLIVSKSKEELKAIRVITFRKTKSKLGIQFGLKTSRFTGPLVTIASVEPNSLADENGIKRDWVLTHLDGEEISVLNSEDFSDFINRVAKKRDKGLTLSFNTLLLPRLKRSMSTMDQTAPRMEMEDTPSLSREREARKDAQQELEDRLLAVEDSRKDMDLINLRSAIERAKDLGISTSKAERKLKVAEILNLFETMKRWDEPEHARCMTDHEKELTDLEQRISNLTSAIACARDLGMETKEAMDTNWKLQGIYRYCKKLGPMSKDTRFFLMRMQELFLEIEQAKGWEDDVNRRSSTRMSKLKKTVNVAMRNAIESQKPKALKVMINVAKKSKIDTHYLQAVLDVIEGLTERSLNQNTSMMKMAAEDAEKLNIPADHVSDYATFLETQKIRVSVVVRDKNEGESRDDRRSSRSKKKKKRKNSDILEFKMFKFNTFRDLKLEAFRKHQISYYNQQWSIEGREIPDEQETLGELGVTEDTEIELYVLDRKHMRWVTNAVLDEVKSMEESLVENMKESKERLVSAIKDKDFHNFLRFSSQLRRQWCKKATTKVHRESIEDQWKDAQRREQQKNRRGYYERSNSYSTAGGGGSSRRGSDSGSRRYNRDRDSFRERYYDSQYGVTVGGVHCIQEDDTPGYSRRNKDYDEY